MLTRFPVVAALLAIGLLGPASSAAQRSAASRSYDLILRGGTIIDGTGAPAYPADIAIAGGWIVRIGDLGSDRAATELDVSGLMVSPGFINLHSHAQPSALPTAENMLTQGVTTELLNADGGGPTDVGPQLTSLEQGGLALNVAASIGFNAIWQSVVGPSNRRPTAEEVEKMRSLVVQSLEGGAFGVSSGLDYKPAYFATADEVVQVLSPARRWRTFFPNHDRITPESGYSSRAGVQETIAIGERAGLVPEITHMKSAGREQGQADVILGIMSKATAEGRWVPADVYPYLAGQTGLGSLIIPGWAQDGGIEQLRARLRDSSVRARIVTESDQAISARFNGPESILVGATRKLSDIMKEQGTTSPGAAIARILETETPMAILGFGVESDLVRILQYPWSAVACDCGAAIGSRGHPRYYGTFPRVLGRYVRETRALGWEDAIRKMSGLPAALSGLVDRGIVAPGMAADLTVFDSATVIDHATFERPDLWSEGIRHVLVNGQLALRDGRPTGARGGVALRRTAHMPSRPLVVDAARELTASAEGEIVLSIAVQQGAAPKAASGTIKWTDRRTGQTIRSTVLGLLQTAPQWASLTGLAKVGEEERPFALIVEAADPFEPEQGPTATVRIAGRDPLSIRLEKATVKGPSR
jgi:N-acyl-D-aspartate/D-glutamate deacylase